jgi:hypothetical protein
MKGRGRKFGQTGGGRGYGICLGRDLAGLGRVLATGDMFRQTSSG